MFSCPRCKIFFHSSRALMVHCSHDQICHHAVTYQLVSPGNQSMNKGVNETKNDKYNFNNGSPSDYENLDKKT